MNARATRVARGWAVGVFATAAAALSHAVAGGGTPTPLALGVGVVFGGMLGTFALSARPSLPRLAIAAGATQLAFHVVFSTLGTAAPVAGHAHGQLVIGQPASHAHVDSPLMWFSHAVAAALTLGLLCHAERAAWRLLTEFARLVVSAFRTTPRLPVATRLPVFRVPLFPVRLSGRILLAGVSRRGPPLPVAF